MNVLRKVTGEPANDNANVARAQKLLTLVDEAAGAGQVDEDTRNRLATTILEELTAAGAADPERRAAAGLISDMSADRTSEVTIDADGSTAVRTHDDSLGRGWDEQLLRDLVRPASWAIPSYQPDEIFLTDDEVQGVLRFFYEGFPAILGHLDGTVLGHELRSLAQGMLFDGCRGQPHYELDRKHLPDDSARIRHCPPDLAEGACRGGQARLVEGRPGPRAG